MRLNWGWGERGVVGKVEQELLTLHCSMLDFLYFPLESGFLSADQWLD